MPRSRSGPSSPAPLVGAKHTAPLVGAKHAAPGLLCDALVPLLVHGGRRPGVVTWIALGGLIGAARFATIFVVTLLAGAPALAWAFLIPGTLVHVGFGALSGLVTTALAKET